MKQIKVWCDRYGGVRIDNPNVLMSHEQKSVSVEISMAGLGLTSYFKRLDILVGKDKTVDYLPKVNTTGDVFTVELEEQHYKKGYLRIQPIAYTEDQFCAVTKKVKWEVIELKVNFSIDVMEITANVEPSLGALLQQDVALIKQDIIGIDAMLTPKYNDIVFEFTPTRINPTTTKPDYDYTNVGFLFPQNIPSEAIFITVQLPHSWKEGTVVYPHVHVRQSANQQAVFKLDYLWYEIGDIIPTVWTTYIMNQSAMPYVSGNMAQVIHGVGGISGVGHGISSILKIKLYRDDNVYVGDILADQFDIHIEVDGFGSQEQFNKI